MPETFSFEEVIETPKETFSFEEVAQPSPTTPLQALAPLAAAAVGEARKAKGIELRRQLAELNAQEAALDPSLGFPVLGDPSGMVPAPADVTQPRFDPNQPSGLSVQGAAEAKGMGEANRDVAPLIAGAVAPAIVLPARLGVAAAGSGIGLLGRLGLAGSVSGAADQTVREVISRVDGTSQGGVADSIGRIATGTAAAGALGVVGGGLAARYLPKIFNAGSELFKSGKDRASRVAAAWMRPMFPSLGQTESAAARALIAEKTGVEVPITGTSEVLGNPKMADEIKNSVAGSEMSAEAIDAIKREVATVASSVRNSGMTAEDLSNGTLEILRNKLGDVSKPSEDAVKALSNQLYPAIQQSFDEIQGAARALVPDTAATPAALGKAVRDAERAAYAGFKATDRANYEAVRALPEASEMRVKPSSYNAVVDEFKANSPQQAVKVEEEFFDVVDEFGRPIPKPPGSETKPISALLPDGTGKFAAPKLAPEQTLEQARQLRTILGDSFNDDTILPGLGSATKRRLYGALTEDINRSIDELPTGNLKEALSKANAYHRENVGRFTGNDIEKILSEFGEQGGSGPAAIIEKFKGADAASFLARLEASAGKEGAPKVAQAAKEFLYNEIGQAARNPVTGEVSVGKLVEGIDKLAPEIRKRFFGKSALVKALAQKEGALNKINPEKIINNLEVDAALLDEALTTGAPEVMKRLGEAIKQQKILDTQLRGSVLGALSKGSSQEVTDAISQNPIKFVRSITDGTYTPDQTSKVLGMVGKDNPELLGQLQFNYVDDLIESHLTKNGISASGIVKSLGGGTATSGPGQLRANTIAVLGQSKTDGLLEVMQALAKLESNQTKLTSSTPLVDVMVKGAGGLLGEVAARSARIGPIGAANQASWLASKYRNGRYRMVAHVLSTPELRKLAITPIGQVSKDTINRLIQGTVSAVSSAQGDNSQAMDDLEAMAHEASR